MKRLTLILLCLTFYSCSSDKDDWEVLFNGKDLTGWHIYNSSSNDNGWYVDNGVMVFDPATRQDASNATLLTNDQFESFELAIDWMISENGNSGLFWAVVEDTSFNYAYETGPEIQMLDDNWKEYVEERGDIQRAGSMFNILPPSEIVANPAGEWNSYLLHINHEANEGWLKLNGTQILEFPVSGEPWQAMVSNSGFANWKAFGKVQKGHIALQDHGSKVAFRRIKIRELNF